ncbi:unnamed protein product [Orchesella dallaii]|uniref:Carboxylic ester hydrolase n=1 Tax=Orchesella dallaii TaxID=48710 RepID=A0ABP1QBJ0_9HEXA
MIKSHLNALLYQCHPSQNQAICIHILGIPYGENTGGVRRWKPPVPKRPWRGVRQAKKPGSDCLQLSIQKMFRVYGSEDCLFINVYSSKLSHHNESAHGLPVIVFIHGGSFVFGSGAEYGPAYMLNENIVLVTLNYRLGALGFLSTGDHHMPGNYGLKDQVLALKWVHENIAYFGGNPRNVSLWGNSAGGVSVHLHLISNKTRDYFSTAMSSSGTAFQPWAVHSAKKMKAFAQRLGQRFGCQNEDSYEFVQCIQRIDSNFLTAAQLSLFDWFPFPPVLFSATVEPPHPDAFLTISPEEAYKTGVVAKKPFIMGFTKDEGKTAMMLLQPLMRTFPLRAMWKQIAPVFLEYKNLVQNPDNLTSLIEEFYIPGKTAWQASLDDFGDMTSDRYLIFGTIRGLQVHANYYPSGTYLYYFAFTEGNHNLANFLGYKGSEWGAGHTEDIFFLFNNTGAYTGHEQEDPDTELSKIMINLMTNFADTGVPEYRTDDRKMMRIWDPVHNPSQINVMQFDKEVKMIPLPSPLIKRLNFWNTLNLPDMNLYFPLSS